MLAMHACRFINKNRESKIKYSKITKKRKSEKERKEKGILINKNENGNNSDHETEVIGKLPNMRHHLSFVV